MNADLQIINKIVVVILNLVGIWLVFWVYSSDRKKALNKGFALLLVPNLLWVDFYSLASLANRYDLSLLFTRLTFASAAIFFIGFYYFFIIWFLDKKGWYFLLGRLVLVYETIFSFLCAFTNLILPEIGIGKFGVIPLFSDFGKITFYFSVVTLVILVIGSLIIRYFQSPQNIKYRIQYFLVGVCIFTISNFIIGVILPNLFNAPDYYFITNYSTLFLLAFTAYAIVKHELMGVKALLTQVLVSIISIILLVDVLFLTNNLIMQLLKLGILATFIYFSWELIKSIKKERESRRELEAAYEKINRYVSQLEKTNKDLEEKYEDLDALLSLNQTSSSGSEIKKSIQNILNILPTKFGYTKIIGAALVERLTSFFR